MIQREKEYLVIIPYRILQNIMIITENFFAFASSLSISKDYDSLHFTM